MIGLWPSHTLWIGRINYLIAHKTSCPAADARPYVLFIVFYRKSYIDFAVCTSIRAALYIEAASMSLPVVIKVCPPAASDVVDRGGVEVGPRTGAFFAEGEHIRCEHLVWRF